jgi:hypothetical protein
MLAAVLTARFSIDSKVDRVYRDKPARCPCTSAVMKTMVENVDAVLKLLLLLLLLLLL